MPIHNKWLRPRSLPNLTTVIVLGGATSVACGSGGASNAGVDAGTEGRGGFGIDGATPSQGGESGHGGALRPATPDECDCLASRADLFAIGFDRAAKPVGSRALAVGDMYPRVVANGAGKVTWAATLVQSAVPGAQFSLWEIAANGTVGRRGTLVTGPFVSTARDGSVYAADMGAVGRISSDSR